MKGLPLFILLAGVLTAGAASAQDYQPDDPPPPGATGDVRAISGEVLVVQGKVLPLVLKVLEIKGIASGLSGQIDPLKAALDELGAKVEEKEIKINLSADVLFDFDKANLREEAGPALRRVAEVLAAYAKAAVLVEGHTDAKGSDKYNQKLSERRAEAVVKWLKGDGVKNKMTARGLGESRPVADNEKLDGSDDPDGRQKNRRVEITVKTD